MFWVGRDIRGYLVPMPLLWVGTPSTRQVVHSPIQTSLEQVQGWSKHDFSGQVLEPHHPHSREFIPNILSNPTLFQFKTISWGFVSSVFTPVTISFHYLFLKIMSVMECRKVKFLLLLYYKYTAIIRDLFLSSYALPYYSVHHLLVFLGISPGRCFPITLYLWQYHTQRLVEAIAF